MRGKAASRCIRRPCGPARIAHPTDPGKYVRSPRGVATLRLNHKSAPPRTANDKTQARQSAATRPSAEFAHRDVGVEVLARLAHPDIRLAPRTILRGLYYMPARAIGDANTSCHKGFWSNRAQGREEMTSASRRSANRIYVHLGARAFLGEARASRRSPARRARMRARVAADTRFDRSNRHGGAAAIPALGRTAALKARADPARREARVSVGDRTVGDVGPGLLAGGGRPGRHRGRREWMHADRGLASSTMTQV